MSRASGVLNGVRRHWTDNGPVLPSNQSTLERKIVECRKYAQHTGRGVQELGKLEIQYVQTFGLLQFVRRFNWFSVSPDSNIG